VTRDVILKTLDPYLDNLSRYKPDSGTSLVCDVLCSS
jgi:hypothetical protein